MLDQGEEPNCVDMPRAVPLNPIHSHESRGGHADADLMTLVREICRHIGIKQRDLAAHLQLKPSQMNLYFSGKVDMRADRLVQVLQILGIDLLKDLNERLLQVKRDANFDSSRAFEEPHIDDSKILAKIGRVQSPKRESLLRIIEILGRP